MALTARTTGTMAIKIGDKVRSTVTVHYDPPGIEYGTVTDIKPNDVIVVLWECGRGGFMPPYELVVVESSVTP